MDNITLFSVITVMSFFLSVPIALFMEGVKFTPAYLQSTVRTSLLKMIGTAVSILKSKYITLSVTKLSKKVHTWIKSM